MAAYKYGVYLAANQDAAFDQLFSPGAQTPFSGIFRCQGCGREIVSEFPKPLPPQNHHQHQYAQGPIVDWSPILRQTVKTHFSLNGELSHGLVTQAVHAGI